MLPLGFILGALVHFWCSGTLCFFIVPFFCPAPGWAIWISISLLKSKGLKHLAVGWPVQTNSCYVLKQLVATSSYPAGPALWPAWPCRLTSSYPARPALWPAWPCWLTSSYSARPANDQLGHADWRAHTQLDQLMTNLAMWVDQLILS